MLGSQTSYVKNTLRGESLPPSLKRQVVFDIPPSSGDSPQRPLSGLATRAFFNLASRLQDSPALSRLGDPFGVRPPQPPHHTRHPYSLAGIQIPPDGSRRPCPE